MDIFGKHMTDYQHLVALDSQDNIEAYLSQRAGVRNAPVHNFDALGIAGVGDFESNAQAIGYMTNNLESVRTASQEVLYTEWRLDEFMVFDNDVPEGAKTWADEVVDTAGEGAFISHQGDNAPSAAASVRLVPYTVAYGGMNADYSRHDVRQAQFAGVALPMKIVQAAMRGCMNHIQKVGFLGDARFGFEGLFNHTDRALAANRTDETAKLSTLTGDVLIKKLQSYANTVVEDTAEVAGRTIDSGLCFYAPIEVATALYNTPRSATTDTSVWEWFVDHNTWYHYTGEKIQLKWVQELKGIAASNSDRLVVGFMNDQVGSQSIPIMPQPLEPENRGHWLRIGFEYTCSGYNLKRPAFVHYYDGV